MDLLNSALQLKIDATQRKSKAIKGNQVFDESEAGFHFIAFVPAKGRVWKFDGLERQPQNLGILLLAAGSLGPIADV
jgi:ubiquitin carboxyl-terminal hydrolase L5